MRRIHRLPARTEACGITVSPTLGAFAVYPRDEEPIKIKIDYQGRHTLKIRRDRHMAVALGMGKTPAYRLWAVDDIAPGDIQGEELGVPNIHSDGRICFGSARIPSGLSGFDQIFWNSPFNTDLAGGVFPGWERPSGVNVNTRWLRYWREIQDNPSRLNVERTVEPWANSGHGTIARYQRSRYRYGGSFTSLYSPDHPHEWHDSGTQVYMVLSDRPQGDRQKFLSRADLKEIKQLATAIGHRLGQRDLPSDSRTPKQAEREAALLAKMDTVAEIFPTLIERHRAYYFHLIEWMRAAGVVRGRRDAVKDEWLRSQGLHPEQIANEAATQAELMSQRRARMAAYFEGDWRQETKPNGEPFVRNIAKDALGESYYMGPGVPALFLTQDEGDLAAIPKTHRAIDIGMAGACAGAFAADGGDGWVLAFPSRTQGLSNPWRATCARDGSGLRAL